MCLSHLPSPVLRQHTHTIFHFRLLNRVHDKVHSNKCNFLVTQWSAGELSSGIRISKNSAQEVAMSAFGPKQTLAFASRMSAFGGKADMAYCSANVRFWPKADIEPDQHLRRVVCHFSLAGDGVARRSFR
jgi:hypothetical protein